MPSVFERSPLRRLFLRERTYLVLRALEARAYLDDLLGPPRAPANKILIFAQGRSGTTLLEELLCSTEHFVGRHEVLNCVTREVLAPAAYVRGLGRRIATPDCGLVVHVKGEHLTDDRRWPVDPASFLRALYTDGWRIISVVRTNTVQKVLSGFITEHRDGYHKRDAAPERLRFRIEPDVFLQRYERCVLADERDRLALKGVPHIALSYEDDLEDAARRQVTIDRIVDALELPTRPVSTDLKKINQSEPADMIANFTEIDAMVTWLGASW